MVTSAVKARVHPPKHPSDSGSSGDYSPNCFRTLPFASLSRAECALTSRCTCISCRMSTYENLRISIKATDFNGEGVPRSKTELPNQRHGGVLSVLATSPIAFSTRGANNILQPSLGPRGTHHA
jgi:hypothetical protein